MHGECHGDMCLFIADLTVFWAPVSALELMETVGLSTRSVTWTLRGVSAIGADDSRCAKGGDLLGAEAQELTQHLVSVLTEHRSRRADRAGRRGEPDGRSHHPHLAR